ncbi:hypothetical protein L1887_54088 [Cichorium endivia]|nr:hypothetical protein L1887_54088 [Cichorium endivia]
MYSSPSNTGPGEQDGTVQLDYGARASLVHSDTRARHPYTGYFRLRAYRQPPGNDRRDARSRLPCAWSDSADIGGATSGTVASTRPSPECVKQGQLRGRPLRHSLGAAGLDARTLSRLFDHDQAGIAQLQQLMAMAGRSRVVPLRVLSIRAGRKRFQTRVRQDRIGEFREPPDHLRKVIRLVRCSARSLQQVQFVHHEPIKLFKGQA